MEKLQSLLNFTNADGEVITVFGGKMTLSQLVVIIGVLLVVIMALKAFKAAMRVITIIVAVCVLLVHYNIASPTQIKDAAAQVAAVGAASYSALANRSQNIKVDGDSLKVCIGEKWYDISDVTAIFGGDSDSATVVVDGESVAVDDTDLIQLIKSFS